MKPEPLNGAAIYETKRMICRRWLRTDVELKHAFTRARWGEGLASEAIPSMTDFAANILKISNIIATVAPQNSASQRVLLKSGFCFAKEQEDDDGERIYVYTWTAGDVPR